MQKMGIPLGTTDQVDPTPKLSKLQLELGQQFRHESWEKTTGWGTQDS